MSVLPRAAATAAALCCLALLAACATPTPAGDDWLSGKLQVKVAAQGEQVARSLSSDFDLKGDAEQGELRLNGPLGTRLATARWAPGSAQLLTHQGEARYTDLDALARDTLGEALPLQALPAWLRGRPWPGAASRSTAAGFEQLGWQVELARYAEGWLEATRAAPPAVTVRARLERAP